VEASTHDLDMDTTYFTKLCSSLSRIVLIPFW